MILNATDSNAWAMSIATADFNGDGRQDLAVVSMHAGNVGIRFGNGDGTFDAPVIFSTGSDSWPVSVVVDDFNHDNRSDLAVTNYEANNIGILLGKGDGTFEGQTTFSTGPDTGPFYVLAHRLNGDDHLDLAVINGNANSIGVLLGSGDGAFKEPISLSIESGCHPNSIIGGDFNGDNHFDLALPCAGSDSVNVFIGSGNGTFTAQVALSGEFHSGPSALAVGDFNCDNLLDLAVTNSGKNNIGVFIGDGNGSFEQQKAYSTGAFSGPTSLVAGDFNNDKQLDLAVVNFHLQNVGVMLGTGNGTFLEQRTFSVGVIDIQLAMVTGDFNSDGKLDIATTNCLLNAAYILLNTCDCC